MLDHDKNENKDAKPEILIVSQIIFKFSHCRDAISSLGK